MIYLGLDFDNTLISYDTLFKKIALDKGLISNKIQASKKAVRDYLRGINQEDLWTKLQGEVYGNHILEAIPYSGMKQSLQILSNSDIPLCIISHKTRTPYLGESYDLHAAARSWLEAFGMHSPSGPNISREKTFFEETKEKKYERIIAEGCTHYVDDLPEILEMLPRNIVKIHFSPQGEIAKNSQWLVMQHWKDLPNLLGLN